MKADIWRLCGCLVLGLGTADLAGAGPKSKLAQEAAEHVMTKFGKEAAQEGVETLARKIEALALRHGDEAFKAVRRVGPRTFHLVEEAGEHGGVVVTLLVRRGDEAVWVVSRRNRLAHFVRWGDDAADAMVKHGEVAEPVLEAYGKPAASALKRVSPQGGRRIAMLAADGDLDHGRRGGELLRVVGEHGDRAVDWIWRNRRALREAVALAAFLADPEPFLAETQAPGATSAEPADHGASGFPRAALWIAGVLLMVAVAVLLVKSGSRRRTSLRK